MSISYTADQLQKKFQGAPGASGFARIAETLREEGRHEEAVALCQEGLGRKPQDLTGRLVLGKCLLDMDRLEEARDQLEGVLRQDPRCLSAMHLLAGIMTRLQWGEAAAAYYRSILELEPWDADTLARFRELSPSGAAGFAAASETGRPGADASPPVQTLEALAAAAPSGPEVEEFDLNEVTGFPPADSTPGDLAGALEEVSLEDALSAPAEAPRAYAPAPPMPAFEEPQPLDVLTEAAPAPDTGADEPAPISGDDVGDRLDSLFGVQDDQPLVASPASSSEPVDPELADATLQLKALRDQEAPSASGIGAATTFSEPMDDIASATAVEAGPGTAQAFDTGRTADVAAGQAEDLARPEDIREEAISPLETSVFSGGELMPPEERVSGEDIEARLDDLFSLHDTSTQPVMKAIPDEPAPRNGDFPPVDSTQPVSEAAATWSGAGPMDAIPEEPSTAEVPPEGVSDGFGEEAPVPEGEGVFPSGGSGSAAPDPSDGERVTGQDVADKLDSLFGEEPPRREGMSGEVSAPDLLESGSASWAAARPLADEGEAAAATGNTAPATAEDILPAWDEDPESSRPPAPGPMAAESILPHEAEPGQGPAITGEDIEDRLDSLFDIADESPGIAAMPVETRGEDATGAFPDPVPTLELRPAGIPEEVTSEEPQPPLSAAPSEDSAAPVEDAGRTLMIPARKESPSDWLARQADGSAAEAADAEAAVAEPEAAEPPTTLPADLPGAGDTLFIRNEDVFAAEPVSAPFPGATDTVGLEMVDGSDIADRLDQIFAAEGPDARPGDSPAAAAMAAAEAAIARGEASEDGMASLPEPEAILPVEEPALPDAGPVGLETGPELEEVPLDEVALFAQDPGSSLSNPEGGFPEVSGAEDGASQTVISGEDIDSRLSEIFEAPAGRPESPHFLANPDSARFPDAEEESSAAAVPTDHDFLPRPPVDPTPSGDAGTRASETGKPEAPSLAPMQDEEEGSPEEEENEPQSAAGANVATVTLAEIYFQQGLREQALQIYRQLLEREPGNDSVRKRIQEIEASKPEAGILPGSDPRRPRPGLKVPKRKK